MNQLTHVVKQVKPLRLETNCPRGLASLRVRRSRSRAEVRSILRAGILRRLWWG